MSSIRPAIETLRELDDKRLLDKTALAINEATSTVRALGKPAKVIITIDFTPSKNMKVVEPMVFLTGRVESKLPKSTPDATIFYIDDDDNPTRNQPKPAQQGLALAPEKGHATGGAA